MGQTSSRFVVKGSHTVWKHALLVSIPESHKNNVSFSQLKKKKKKAKSQYFEPHYSGTVNKWSSQATWWVFLKDRSQWEEVHHYAEKEWRRLTLASHFRVGQDCRLLSQGRPAPVDTFLASHWLFLGHRASLAPCMFSRRGLPLRSLWHEQLLGSPNVLVRGQWSWRGQQVKFLISLLLYFLWKKTFTGSLQKRDKEENGMVMKKKKNLYGV